MLNQPKFQYNVVYTNHGMKSLFRQMNGWKMSYKVTENGAIFGVYMPEKGVKKENYGKKEN